MTEDPFGVEKAFENHPKVRGKSLTVYANSNSYSPDTLYIYPKGKTAILRRPKYAADVEPSRETLGRVARKANRDKSNMYAGISNHYYNRSERRKIHALAQSGKKKSKVDGMTAYVAKSMDPFGVSKAGYSETHDTIRGHRKKARTQAHIGNAATAAGGVTAIGSVYSALPNKTATAVGNRVAAKATANSITHGMSGKMKYASRAGKVANVAREVAKPGMGSLIGLGTAATLAGTGVGFRVASLRHQKKANEIASSYNKTTKGKARIKQQGLTLKPRHIYKSFVSKSAFGVDHEVTKSVLLPKPFKGLKPLKPKGLKLSKPGANTKTDNTMAGGTH